MISWQRFCATLLLLLFAALTFAESRPVLTERESSPLFVRIQNNADGQPRALQTAITSYSASYRGERVTVDLISALHIGDASYYATLNQKFESYDALLYELVADSDVRPIPGMRKTSTIAKSQVFLKDALDLEYQLDQIDYSAGNFVHADFTPEQMSTDMQHRDESLYDYFWRIFFASLEQSAMDPLGIDAIVQMVTTASSDKENKVKLAAAYELAKQADLGDILFGENGSSLIQGRNIRALAVLGEQLESGARRIGIFYGAGHMPDFDRRLRDEFNYEYGGSQWLDAWLLD